MSWLFAGRAPSELRIVCPQNKAFGLRPLPDGMRNWAARSAKVHGMPVGKVLSGLLFVEFVQSLPWKQVETLELEGDVGWRHHLENADLSTEMKRLECNVISILIPITRDIEDHCCAHGEEATKEIGDWIGEVKGFLGAVRCLAGGE